MKKPIIALVAVLCVFGFMNNVYALKLNGRPTETWLHSQVPDQVGAFALQPDGPNSKVSYKMGEVVYKELDPVGIAAQKYAGPGGQSFDAVIVSGDRMESFHDQRWCFKAQGWDIKSEEDAMLQTQSHGAVPAKLVQITRTGVLPAYAVFTFRGPSKFHSDISSLSRDYFFYELFRQKKYVGTEYRVIPLFAGSTKEDVLKFTADYVDATFKSSGGKL